MNYFLFSGILPEALENNCIRCTEKQKVAALRTIRRLRKEYPKVWHEVTKLWDPSGEHVQRFEDSFKTKKDNERSATISTSATVATSAKPIFNRFGDNDFDDAKDQYSSSTTKAASTPSPRPQSSTSQTVQRSPTTRRATVTLPLTTKAQTYATSTLPTMTTTTADDFPTPTLKNIFNVKVPENGKLPTHYQINIKIPVISAGNKILGSITEISNKFMKVGAYATKVLFSTLHAIVGKHSGQQ